MKWRIGTNDWINTELTDKIAREYLEERAKAGDRYAPFIECDIFALEGLKQSRVDILGYPIPTPDRCQNIPIHLVEP